MLDLDDSGRFFWAVFEDGIRAALLADAELLGVAYSDLLWRLKFNRLGDSRNDGPGAVSGFHDSDFR